MVTLLLESNIPHNMVMLRGPPFTSQNLPGGGASFNASTDDTGTDVSVVRTLLVPRKPAYGMLFKFKSYMYVSATRHLGFYTCAMKKEREPCRI